LVLNLLEFFSSLDNVIHSMSFDSAHVILRNQY
jgi:hypothetical protein